MWNERHVKYKVNRERELTFMAVKNMAGSKWSGLGSGILLGMLIVVYS